MADLKCQVEMEPGYTLVKPLGSGEYGQVCQVTKDKQTYAVKIQRIEQAAVTEALILQQLDHPNILKPTHISVNAKADRLYIYQPLYQREAKSWTRGRITAEQLTTLAIKLARAFHYLHSHGIIHGDFKPDNLLYDGDEPIILDLGLAEFCPGPQRAPLLIGKTPFIIQTITYRAPELMCRESITTYSTKVDMYALGATLYALWHRRSLPTSGDTDTDSMYYAKSYEVASDTLLALATAQPKIHSLLAPLLQHQASMRYTAARYLEYLTHESTKQIVIEWALDKPFTIEGQHTLRRLLEATGVIAKCPESSVVAWLTLTYKQSLEFQRIYRNLKVEDSYVLAVGMLTGSEALFNRAPETYHKYIRDYLGKKGKLIVLPRFNGLKYYTQLSGV